MRDIPYDMWPSPDRTMFLKQTDGFYENALGGAMNAYVGARKGHYCYRALDKKESNCGLFTIFL